MKKVITIIIMVALVFSAVACSSNTPAATSAAASSAAPAASSAAPAATSAAPATSEAAAAPSGDHVKANKQYTIGVSLMDYNFTFFQDMLAAMKMEAAADGVIIKDYDSKQDSTKQLNDVQDMINALKVDGIILNPVDTSAIVPAVMDANDAKIPVITVDVGAAGGTIASHIASDNVAIGTEEAKFVVDQLTKKNGAAKGTIAILTYPKITSMRSREEGFMAEIQKYPDITVINKSPIQVTAEDTMTLVEDLLTTYPSGKLDLIDATNSSTALGAMAALKSANRTDVLVIGTDEDPDILAAIADKSSTVMATVVQYPNEMGRLAILNMVKLLNGEQIEAKINTKIENVNKDNIADYQKVKDAWEAEIASYK